MLAVFKACVVTGSLIVPRRALEERDEDEGGDVEGERILFELW